MARVTLSLSVRAIVFSNAHCPACGRRIMAVPGAVLLEVRHVASDAERSGRGRVVSCRRCHGLCEVIEHDVPHATPRGPREAGV